MMTKEQKIIKAKVGLLELAKQLGNVSQACKMLGYSRDSFYRFMELYDKGGELAPQEISRKKPILANRAAPEIEARIVAFSLEQPAFGQIRVANEMRKLGFSISPAGVRGVWLRHDLETMKIEAQSPGSEGRTRGSDPDRGAGHRLGESQNGKGGARRVRERVPRLLRRPGHFLRRQHEGRWPHLSADFRRHLFEGDFRKALRSQDADHRG
jgi:Winged helix-turn helix